MIRYISLLFIFVFNISCAQIERNFARSGNSHYDKGLFLDSEIDYRKALSLNSSFEEVKFNLADALFRQDRYDDAINNLNDLISSTTNMDLKSEAYYNLGNNFLKQQKLEEAVDAYKNCLRINPHDEEARYNLAKTLSILNQQQKQDKNEQNEEGNQEDKNEQKNQNSGETDSSEEENKKDSGNNKVENNNSESDSNQRQDDNSANQENDDLSIQEMERVLDALEREEQKIQKEIRKVSSINRNVEKDW